MIKAVFSASLFQSSASHNPSEINLILFAAQKTFLIIIAASYLCRNHDALFRINFIYSNNDMECNNVAMVSYDLLMLLMLLGNAALFEL